MTKPIDEVFERCTQTRSAVRGQSRVASSSPQCVSIPVPRAAAPLPPIGSTSFGRQLTLPADFFVSFNFGDQVLA